MARLHVGAEVTDGGVFAGVVVDMRERVTVIWTVGDRFTAGFYYGAAQNALTPTGNSVSEKEALAMHNGYLKSRGLPER